MTVPPPTDPTEIAKGGLWGGTFNSIGVDLNTRALLLDILWVTTDGGSIPATRIPYSFPTQVTDYTDVPGGYPSPNLLVGFSEVSPEQKTAVRFTFDLVSSYTKLTFVENASGLAADAAIRVAHYGQGGSEAYTPSHDGRTAGDTFIGGNATVSAQQIGSDGLLTIMHELGHALGLKHGHESELHGALASNFNDNEFSIMTYASYLGAPVPPPTSSVAGSSPQSLMMFDISALQALYGANYDKLGTAERYSWNTTTGQQLIDGQPAPHTGTTSTDKIFSTIWTQGAAATYDLRDFTQNQVDDLRPGHWLKFDNDKLADLNSDAPGTAIAQGNIYNALLYKDDLHSAIANLTTGIGNDTLIGNDRDNVLSAGDGTDIIVTSGGNDIVSGGANADILHFGPGHSTLRDSMADLNSDVVHGFGFGAVDVLGMRLGWDNVTITATQTTISAGILAVQLDGSFAGNGAFILSARGGGADAHTAVGYVNYLPNLAEGVSVNTSSISGLADQSFLTGDGSVRFTLEFKSAVSAFANTLGFYKVKADGSIGDVHILFDNTLNVAASAHIVDLGAPANGERIGFFLIQDGFHNFGHLADDLSFVAPGTDRAATIDSGLAILKSASLGALTGAMIFHSSAALNPNGANQVLSGVKPSGQELLIGFEDLPNATGDRDFQDVVIGIHVTGDGFLFT
jgi:serralysin